MYKTTEFIFESAVSSGVRGLRWDSFNPVFQLIPSDKLGLPEYPTDYITLN